MSHLHDVIDTYHHGLQAASRGDWMLAARWFRLCHTYYEEGELPVFWQEVKDCGLDAVRQYAICTRHLTAAELSELGDGRYTDWRTFVRQELAAIARNGQNSS